MLWGEARRENMVAARCVGMSIEFSLPILAKVVRRNMRATVRLTTPLFPGYLFVRPRDDDQWHDAKKAPGVRRYLRIGDYFATVPHEAIVAVRGQEVDMLRRARGVAALSAGRPREPNQFQIGDRVRLGESAGALAGIYGRLAEADERDRLRIFIQAFGGEVPMEVAADALESAGV